MTLAKTSDAGPMCLATDNLEKLCDLLDGQELFGVEQLLAQVAKLIADDIPHKLTQRCLDTEKPSCLSLFFS